MVGRKKCLPQDLLELRFGRVAGIDPGRAADDPVAQDGRADLADTETIVTDVFAHRARRLGARAAVAAKGRDEHA
ncbi:hypothetical protein D3C87_1977730 [compost metagenome]